MITTNEGSIEPFTVKIQLEKAKIKSKANKKEIKFYKYITIPPYIIKTLKWQIKDLCCCYVPEVEDKKDLHFIITRELSVEGEEYDKRYCKRLRRSGGSIKLRLPEVLTRYVKKKRKLYLKLGSDYGIIVALNKDFFYDPQKEPGSIISDEQKLYYA